MNQKKSAVLLSVALCLNASGVVAQAFGVEKGVLIEDLKVIEDLDDNVYAINPPQPNSEFNYYMVFAVPEVGVCRVMAMGRTHDNDRYGTSVRKAFSELSLAITTKYGPGEIYDIKREASLGKPEYWTSDIIINERSYYELWADESGARLPDDISVIRLKVMASEYFAPYLNLMYEFDNASDCLAHNKRDIGNGL